MSARIEFVDDTHLRITQGQHSVLVETFLCPIMQGTLAFAYRRPDNTVMIVTESYADSSGSDNPVSFQTEGMLGEAQRDFDYWWEDGIPKDLAINENVPFWAVDSFMSV